MILKLTNQLIQIFFEITSIAVFILGRWGQADGHYFIWIEVAIWKNGHA